jgi:hypothetical protein
MCYEKEWFFLFSFNTREALSNQNIKSRHKGGKLYVYAK